MAETVRAFDFGGSGAKTAVYEMSASTARRVTQVEILANPDYGDLATWLRSHVDVRETLVGVSCAGFVDLVTGVNHKWNVAGLTDYPLAAEIERAYPIVRSVQCLNDVEAHLWSSVGEFKAPILSIAVGTSVGIAVADERGRIVRTRSDRPLECGNVRLRTSASTDVVWWALGTAGLKEEQERRGEREGAERFGYRVGAFAAQYAVLFQARTVVLSGGVIEHNWPSMAEAVESEFEHGTPSWMRQDPPRIVASKLGREAGLVGAARYAFART